MIAYHGKEETKKFYQPHKKALAAVKMAKAFFEQNRFEVTDAKSVSANGPDLSIGKNGAWYRVEVKLAFFSKRAWKVKKVSRKNDDFIAIVFPSGGIRVDQMKDHLAHCSSNGDRSITALGVVYES